MLFECQIRDFFHWLPSERLKKEKQDIRVILMQRLRVLHEEDRAAYSAIICDKIRQSQLFQEAKVVMMFYPIKNEVDLRPLMEEFKDTKTILLPVAHRRSMEMRQYVGEDHLQKGKFGIPEPNTEACKLRPDLIITPGIAFDSHCNRLGRGGGYYDRFLKRFRLVPTIGVAYDFQIVKKIPMAWFDRPLNAVVSVSATFATE